MDCVDQIGRVLSIPNHPQRIISTVPSISELLADLNLSDEIIGITKFCVHPDRLFRSKEKIGGTKKLNIEKIKHLKPDLIIANKEENLKSEIEELSNHFPVWISDVNDLNTALEMILEIGQMTNRIKNAVQLCNSISEEFEKLEDYLKHYDVHSKSATYLIWNKPFMAAGSDTFISSLLNKCRLSNCIKKLRYPEITINTLQNLNPDIILLSSEPFPFKEIHQEQLNTYFKGAKIVLVDGEMFSWYGSRLIKSPTYFISLLNQLKE